MNEEPPISLDAIPDPQNSEEYTDLVTQIADLTANIEDMEDQLEVRDDQPWRSHCLFNVRRHRALRDQLLQRKQAMDSVSYQMQKKLVKIAYHEDRNRIEHERAQIRKSSDKEARQLKHEKHMAYLKAQKEAREAKKERIRLANEDQERFTKAFKKVVKSELGEDRYLELVSAATKLMEEGLDCS